MSWEDILKVSDLQLRYNKFTPEEKKEFKKLTVAMGYTPEMAIKDIEGQKNRSKEEAPEHIWRN